MGAPAFLKMGFIERLPLMVLVDLEGEIGSEEYDIFNKAWKDQQFFERDQSHKVIEEFKIREKEVHFIPQKRIELLLEEAGFIKVHKFFKAYLFGGYVAIKR